MVAHIRAQRALPSLLRASSSALRPSGVPSFARSLQTTADSCSLVGSIPDSPTEPFQIKLHPEYFQTHRCDTPSLLVDVTKNSLVEMYQQMITMRRMEMAADQLYKAVRSLSPRRPPRAQLLVDPMLILLDLCRNSFGASATLPSDRYASQDLDPRAASVVERLRPLANRSPSRTGSCFGRHALCDEEGRQDYHRLPLPPFCCAEGRNDQGRYC